MEEITNSIEEDDKKNANFLSFVKETVNISYI